MFNALTQVDETIQAAASGDATLTYTLAFLAQVLAYAGVPSAAALASRTWGPQRGAYRSDFDLTDLVHDEDRDTCTLHVEFEGMRFKVTVEMEDWID